jgi:type IV secretory pathway VirB3-like protein
MTVGHFLFCFSKETDMQNYNGYPVFKGLQRPLEFMGIRGRFLTYAAGAIGVSFIGFIVFSIVMGKLAGFIAMIALAIAGLITIYVKQRSGLHAKRHDRGIFVYQGLYNH